MSAPAFLVVRIGGVHAALPAAAVRRVVRGTRVHPLPGAGEGLLGLAEFAGEPLAVLDLARVSGLAAPSGAALVTVVAWVGADAERELVGLAVDEALEVCEIDGTTVAGGEALLRGRPVSMIDPQRLGADA
jgi:chemotaxis signal transduction protein